MKIPTTTRDINLPDVLPEYPPILAAKLRKLAQAGYVTLADTHDTRTTDEETQCATLNWASGSATASTSDAGTPGPESS